MKINEYPELISLTDADLILGWDAETGTTRKIKASTIKTYCTNASSTENIFTYTTDGDNSGIFYWLGTYGTGVNWANPYSLGYVSITASSFYDSGNSDVSRLVNRLEDNGIATGNQANSWIKIDFRQRKLQPTYYSIRARQFNANLIKSWKLQASDDNNTWTDLDIRVGQNTAASKWFSFPVIVEEFYRFFRILQTGLSSSSDNILTLGEIELYGTFRGNL